jgi:uncharacterized membrane protein
METSDSALIVTAWLTMTLVLTVMSAQASIRMLTKGTRTAETDIALTSFAANEAIAYRTAAKLTDEAPATEKAPTA